MSSFSSPYFRISLFFGLFLPAFVGGLYPTTTDAPQPAEAPPVPSIELGDSGTECMIMVASKESAKPERKVFRIVEQMPLFPGPECGYFDDYETRKGCSDRTLSEYVSTHVGYPQYAKDHGVTGMAVVSFVVEANGVINEIKVVRDPGKGLGEAVARLVWKMRKENLRWEPGLDQGKPVAVQFNLPVKFKLD